MQDYQRIPIEDLLGKNSPGENEIRRPDAAGQQASREQKE